MKKIKIVALVGKSGSGKTHASFIMSWKYYSKFHTIVSFTTRPMRAGEAQGRDHWFVSPNQVPPQSEMAAYTVYGGYEYWTTWDQFIDKLYNVYVIDEKGLVDLIDKPNFKERVELIKVKIARPGLDGIADERTLRDAQRQELEDSFYDYVVTNDHSLKDFEKLIFVLCNRIIEKEKWQHQ